MCTSIIQLQVFGKATSPTNRVKEDKSDGLLYPQTLEFTHLELFDIIKFMAQDTVFSDVKYTIYTNNNRCVRSRKLPENFLLSFR